MGNSVLSKSEARKMLRFKKDISGNYEFGNIVATKIEMAVWNAYLKTKREKKGQFLKNTEHFSCICRAVEQLVKEGLGIDTHGS
jgi:hypothetical protein